MLRQLFVACVIAAAGTASSDARTIAVLAFGQSNMQGRFGPATYTDADPSISVWNIRSHRWQVAQLGVFPFWISRGETTPANNLAYVFAHDLVARCDVKVDITFLAAGGKRIEYFIPPNILARHGWVNHQTSPLFGESLADELFSPDGAASEALKAAGASRYDVVLVHQGEANSDSLGDDANTYAEKLATVLTELVRRGLTDPETPTVLGTINPGYAKAAEQAKAVKSFTSNHVAVANWTGIEAYAKTTGTGQERHATGRGLQELGNRYFDAYWGLIGGQCPTFQTSEVPTAAGAVQ